MRNIESGTPSPEIEPRKLIGRATFFRHGAASYEYDEAKRRFEGPLSEEGRKQAREAAYVLADRIDPNREFIVVWTSSLERAVETSQIITEVLEERGFKIVHSKEVESLSMTKITRKYGERALQEGFPHHFTMFLVESEKGELPEGVEPAEKIEKREKRWIHYLQRAIRKISEKGAKTPHFIVVGHDTSVNLLMQESFGRDIVKKSGVGNTEPVEMELFDDKALRVTLENGETAAVRQDGSTRNFKKIQ